MLTRERIRLFHDQGYLVVENVLTKAEVEILREALVQLALASPGVGKGGEPSTNYLKAVHDLPQRPGPLGCVLRYRPVLQLAEHLVGGPVQTTGGLLIAKDPESNWDIPWHQDTGIYVAATPPGEPEDIRDGLPVYTTKHLELSSNVTCRLALDPALADSGGLYVLPGSHQKNLGQGADFKERIVGETGVLAPQPLGSALFYRPLILHRSEKMAVPGFRRILHLSYGPMDLRLPGAQIYPWSQPCPLTPVDELA